MTKKRDVGQRWTERLARSWTPVSDAFLDHYHELGFGVTNIEAMLVIHLVRYKWDEAHPFPSFRTLASKMCMTQEGVRKHVRRLEQKGCLRRIKRVGQPNRFDLTPLFEALEKLVATVEAKKAKDAAKLS